MLAADQPNPLLRLIEEAWQRARARRLAWAILAVAAVTGTCLYFFVGGGSAGSAPASNSQGELTYTVAVSSMEPTLHCAKPGPGCEGQADDRVVVRPVGTLSRGDIIAFQAPARAASQCAIGGIFVKRIVGLPGDTISFNGRQLNVNRALVPEDYIPPGRLGGTTGAWHVPRGQYFTMGDSRAQSCDSRRWGGVPKGNVKGKVTAIERPGQGRISVP
jgi:signal peptidase I